MKRVTLALIGLAVLVALGSIVLVKVLRSKPITIEQSSTGLKSLKYNGVEYLISADLQVNEVLLRRPSGQMYQGSKAGKVQEQTENQAVRHKFPWGMVDVSYAASGNQLNIKIRTENISQTDTIETLWYEPLNLQFPSKVKEYDGSNPLLVHSLGGPAILRVTYDSGSMIVAGEDPSKPLLFGFPWALDRPASTAYPLKISTGRIKSYPDSYPEIKRPIPPGSADEYNISIRFGSLKATPEELAGDVYKKYRETFPPQLNWPDRRPIGSIFLATSATNWPTNPRGWLLDSKLDVESPEGLIAFRDGLMGVADSAIRIMKQMNAQGAITWDIEGQQYAHAVSYIGDPRIVSKLAPEIDSLADEYFKRMRDAGFRVGVCVRPEQIEMNDDGKIIRQKPTSDPAAVLIDKIGYAKKRWGITLAYVDSNVNATEPTPLDASVIKKVADAFPDVLLIPEHSTPEYYAYSAPYRELRQGYASTSAGVRAIYPKAFTVISTVDGPIDQRQKDLMRAIKQGDTAMYRTWYPDPQNAKVKALFKQ